MTRHRNSKGTLVDTWEWKTPSLVSEYSAHLRGEEEEPHGRDAEMLRGEDYREKLVTDRVLKLEVRLLKRYFETGDRAGQLRAVEFSVRCDEIGLGLYGSDIEALRVAAYAKLEERFQIAWERYFLVQIASAQSFKGDYEVGFALSQNTVFRGVAHDGTVLMREYDRSRTHSPWRYRPWPEVYEDRGSGHVIACIKDTPANSRALDEFRERIIALQERLSDLVKPTQIAETLANLANVGLPAPEPAKDSDR